MNFMNIEVEDKNMLCLMMIIHDIKKRLKEEKEKTDLEEFLIHWTKEFEINDLGMISEIEQAVLQRMMNVTRIPIDDLLNLYRKSFENDSVDILIGPVRLDKQLVLKVRSYSLSVLIKDEIYRRTK